MKIELVFVVLFFFLLSTKTVEGKKAREETPKVTLQPFKVPFSQKYL